MTTDDPYEVHPMPRSLSMTLIALLATACVQAGAAPSGSPVVPSALATTTGPAVSAPPTVAPGAPNPDKTRRPRPQRTDRPKQLPTLPPSELPTAPSSELPTAPPTQAALPDLDLGGWTVRTGDTPDVVKVEVYVKNIGTADAGPFFVDGLCAGYRSFWQVDEGLSAGSEMTLKSEFSLNAPPDFPNEPPRLLLDSEDQVLEANENNRFTFDEPLCQL